uniref:Pentatricopeptide repeat-containing protein At3g22470-like n=1 Tax=Rhizophora mucronata TaxID=61149 RepID=A0A2P2Q7V1_RHIMU
MHNQASYLPQTLLIVHQIQQLTFPHALMNPTELRTTPKHPN